MNIKTDKKRKNIFSADFLQKQIRLPKKSWDKDFRRFIEKKFEENQIKEKHYRKKSYIKKKAPLLKGFNRYTKELNLNEHQLRNKKILDLGCGDGSFIKYLIDKKITANAYGIDIRADKIFIEKKFRKNIFQGNFEKTFKFSGFDYMVSVNAVSLAFWADMEIMNIKNIIKNCLKSLKRGGEIRICPIQEPAKATPLKGLGKSFKKWQKLIKDISKNEKTACFFIPQKIRIVGRENNIIFESLLIIKKIK